MLRNYSVPTGFVIEPFFRKSLTVMNGTVAFDVEGNMDPCDCVDIAPEEIYRGRQVEDPLQETA